MSRDVWLVAYPRWMRVCAWGAIAAALPTIVWRAVVGIGPELGTPESWRSFQHIPGSGTAYVLALSAIQLVAALLTLVLVWPRARRLPWWLVAGGATLGAVALAAVCVTSIVFWDNVDPFSGAPATAWAWLCWGCYAVTLLWPALLAATIVGYVRRRRP